jgi:hypothetical protein
MSVMVLGGDIYEAQAGICDIDNDCNIDLDDIRLITAGRNTPASSPDDPRDADGDGMITALDARKCVIQCTLPRCALVEYSCEVPARSAIFPESVFDAGINPSVIKVVDLNRDGIHDIVTNTSILIGNPDGTFQKPLDYNGGRDFAVRDLNADENIDLVTTATESISVFIGNGDGTFQPPKTITLPGSPYSVDSVAIEDFNNDGLNDVAVGIFPTQDPNNIIVLLGNGDGSFGQPTGNKAGKYPRKIITEDFNRDGDIDLAVSDTGTGNISSSISIFLGNGDGTFQPRIAHEINLYPESLITGDFNEDNYPDLAVTNLYSAEPTILIGNGDGTFTERKERVVTEMVTLILL